MLKNALKIGLLMLVTAAAFGEPTPSELRRAIEQHRRSPREFDAIARLAEESGLRVFMFGGTASTFAHHVRSGATTFNFAAMYRDNQDLDIVVTRADGGTESEGQIEEFQKEVARLFPYFRGKNSKWEVRGLKTAHGTKEALLGNPDFVRQHSDSHSTGLIELTQGPDPIVRDLRDWQSEEPRFLQDVAAARNTFYFEETHAETPRAKSGSNPPIEAAVRYLTKVFQHELTMDPVSEAHVAKIIEEFDPRSVEPIVANWLEKNGKKLFQNALDVEHAWDTLERLGLRKKLIALEGDIKDLDSLAVWMSKEPLRSHAGAIELLADVVAEKPRTAADLKIEMVTHETKDVSAYEAITASPKGKPSAFVSRSGHAGEQAGQTGFYTCVGDKGARRSGFHIRFKVDPTALEGVDFIYQGEGRSEPAHVVWLNSSKLTVIRQGAGLKPSAVLQFVASKEAENEYGIRERLRRLAANESGDAEERARFLDVARGLIEGRRFPIDWIKTIFSFSISTEIPELLELMKPDFEKNTGFAAIVYDEVRKGSTDKICPEWKAWMAHPEKFYAPLFEGGELTEIKRILADKHFPASADAFVLAWRNHPERISAAEVLEEELVKRRSEREFKRTRYDPPLNRRFFLAPGFFDLPGTRAVVQKELALDPGLWEEVLDDDLHSPDPILERQFKEWIAASPGHAYDFYYHIGSHGAYSRSRALDRMLHGMHWDPKLENEWADRAQAILRVFVDEPTNSQLQRQAREARRDSERHALVQRMAAQQAAARALFYLPPALRPPNLLDTLLDPASDRVLAEMVTGNREILRELMNSPDARCADFLRRMSGH